MKKLFVVLALFTLVAAPFALAKERNPGPNISASRPSDTGG